MLTADLVRVNRKGDDLFVRDLDARAMTRAVDLAAGYLGAADACVGLTRADFEEACAAIEVRPTDKRLADGLRKLVGDRCTFEMNEEVDPPALRRQVFERACLARRALGRGEAFDRDAVLGQVAADLQLAPEAIDAGLYADLRAAHRLIGFESTSPERLVAQYRTAQAQAVLLRAERVRAHVRCEQPGAYRQLFRSLKFRRLLYALRPEPDGGYRLDIDGPHSLFQSSTKYGLQLALTLPAIQACDHWRIEADVRWGKVRKPLRFLAAGSARPDDAPPPRLPDEVDQLLARFRELDTPWRARPASKVLELPGVGLCVPDVTFLHEPTSTRAYLEVMGYWSRDAVWRRVELVQAGLRERIIFAVSSRLRVSEAVLDDDLPGQLYVYKGVISARSIAERLDATLAE